MMLCFVATALMQGKCCFVSSLSPHCSLGLNLPLPAHPAPTCSSFRRLSVISGARLWVRRSERPWRKGWPFLLCPVVSPVCRQHQCTAPRSSAFPLAPHDGARSVLPGLVHPVLPSTGCLFLPAVLMTFLMAKQMASLLAFVPSTRSSLRGPV